jgi:hypothetical protein
MPILWGNGRLLIGLVEVYDRTGDPSALALAKRLGDYFIATDPVYNKAENIRNVGGGYADGFVTCYFSCIEGLVGLGRVTKDQRYLDEAKRIAGLAASHHQLRWPPQPWPALRRARLRRPLRADRRAALARSRGTRLAHLRGATTSCPRAGSRRCSSQSASATKAAPRPTGCGSTSPCGA